ncbi:MAG: outer membrane lipoprotein carrier protein LolA [Bacteroidia bacterium]|nr:outer membrane lipoprotein carrier protein LolA [Bacteroidia bacterium]
MKAVFLFSVLILVTGSLFAQQDTNAKEILDKLSQTSKSYKTIQIDFSFTLENKTGSITETNEGSVALKGKSYRLHMPAMGMEVFSNSVATWSYLTESNEVNITENDADSEAALNPANLFTIYEKGFNYTYIGEESIGGKTSQVIDLFPIDKAKEFTKVRLYVDKIKYQILRAKTFNKDGNVYTLSMKNMKTDQILADDYFKFDPAKYPKVEINDMR